VSSDEYYLSAREGPRPASSLCNLHDCRSVPGESGSKLLHMGGGEPESIGVLVAGSKQEGAAPSIAMPASAFGLAVANNSSC
jgi:hypothetical protein